MEQINEVIESAAYVKLKRKVKNKKTKKEKKEQYEPIWMNANIWNEIKTIKNNRLKRNIVDQQNV